MQTDILTFISLPLGIVIDGVDSITLYGMMKRRIVKIISWFLGLVLALCLLITACLYFFKDEICGYVISEVNLHLKAKVKIAAVDLAFWGSFPNLSVDFNKVFIQDSYSTSTEKDTLLYSDRIRLKFNPLDVWNEKYNLKAIDISPGTIQLKIDKNGVNNFDILKPFPPSSSSNFNLKLEKVAFTDIRFSFNNKTTDQFYSTYLTSLDLEGAFSEKEFTLHSKSNLFVNEVRSGSVPLISNKPANFDISIFVNKVKNTFEISNANLFVSNLPFSISGIVTDTDLSFRIQSKNLELKDVATNFSHASLENIKKFDGAGIVYFNVLIDGKTNSVEAPVVKCDFGIKNGALTEPSKGLRLTSINLKGAYSNKGGKTNEFLKLSNVSFNTIGGPFYGEVELTNFDNPLFVGSAKGNVNLHVAHSLFSFPKVDSIGGNIDLNSVFIIQNNFLEDGTNSYNILKCEGGITFKNVSLKLKEDKRLFKQLNGSVYLRDNEVGLSEISIGVGATDLKLDGVFKNVFGFLRAENKLEAELDIQSNFLDIQDLSIQTKEDQISDGRNWILPATITAQISLNANEIKYEKHLFKQFKGSLNVSERSLVFTDISLQNANALINGTVQIEEKLPEIFTITTHLFSDNIEFKALFREWNNFEQEVLKEDNIFGKARVNIYFTAPFDLMNGVVKNAIKSQISLKISEGRLKNVSTFQQIATDLKASSAKLLFKKSVLNEFENKLIDLKFEEFENTLLIRNGQLEIPRMMIKSNALDLDFFGTHGFDDKIDYHFSFNLRQISKQNTSSEFGQEIDDENGMKIFLKMFGTVSNPILKWDTDAKKEQSKVKREEEKQTTKSILKTEFGLFKNDTSVKLFKEVKKPKEELKMEFENDKKNEIEPPIKPKKESKFSNTLKKWKQEADKEKKENVE